MPCISRAATATASTIRPILLSNSAARLAPRGVAFLLGARFGFAALGGGAGLGGVGGFGFGGLLRRGHEQVRQLMGNPDQHAGFEQQDAGMQHDAAEIGAAGKDRRRKDEVQQQMMQATATVPARIGR